jgi:hypothetical protein
MKDNLEKNIKDSLNGFEMPYDAAAWTSLSNKLDQAMPTTPTKPSNLKWYLGGAAAIAVIVTGVLMYNQSDDKKTKNIADNTTVVETPTDKTADATSSQNEENTNAHNTRSNEGSTQSSGVQNELNEPTGSTSAPAFDNVQPNYNNQVNSLPDKGTQGNSGSIGDNSGRTNTPLPNGKKVIIPTVSNICAGESVTVNNTNDVELVIFGPDFRTIIPANKKKSFTPENEGSYKVSYNEGSVNKTESLFSVNEAPSAEIVVNDVEDNGIPTIEFSTPSTGTKYSWDLGNNSGTYSGTEVTGYFFNKKDYTVTLTVIGSNGCSSTAIKKISMESDYNLNAPNAIQTNDPDVLRNSFMPEALTVRSVDFTMIIIEPSTGSILFETSDATNRWTGVDHRTGQYVDVNKTYIWKVTLKNPVRGEKSEYKGQVVRVQ